jgi:hypothetical protein
MAAGRLEARLARTMALRHFGAWLAPTMAPRHFRTISCTFRHKLRATRVLFGVTLMREQGTGRDPSYTRQEVPPAASFTASKILA